MLAYVAIQSIVTAVRRRILYLIRRDNLEQFISEFKLIRNIMANRNGAVSNMTLEMNESSLFQRRKESPREPMANGR